MTKSFTASTILLLRDAGALRLDDLAQDYVPELRDLVLPSADSPRPTLRHLLTMTGGFPTDDPWGDRQQGLAPAEFAALLRGGMRLAWVPGTRFEYSNTGTVIPGQGHRGGHRRALLRGRPGPDPPAPGHDQDRLRGRRVRPRHPDPRSYHRGTGGWAELVPDGTGPTPPWAGCSARWPTWPGGSAASPPRSRPVTARMTRPTR